MSEILNYKKLYIAYRDCRKTKRGSLSAVEFEFDLENNLCELLHDLKNGSYEPGESICFVVRDPKPREIFAAGFRDRIVHHLLVNELQMAGERAFIYDSYACRADKGTHRAVERLRKFFRNAGAGRKPLYFLQLDIDGFFMNIDKQILFSLVNKLIDRQKKTVAWKCDVSRLAEKIIFHDPTKNYRMNSPLAYFQLIPDRKSLFKQGANKGLPIGNYSSQFFANLYLNELDQFAKRQLKCRMYLRYVDDFILLHSDPLVLKQWMKQIKLFVRENLDIKISDRKIRMQEVAKGIDFLGYFIKPNYALARKSVVMRFKRKLKDRNQNIASKDDINFKAMVSSYFGHFCHADCRNLIRKYEVLLK